MKFGLLPSVTLWRLLDAILGTVVLPGRRVESHVTSPQFVCKLLNRSRLVGGRAENPRSARFWFSHAMQDFAAYDQVVDLAMPIIARLVEELRLRKRVADHRRQTKLPSAAREASRRHVDEHRGTDIKMRQGI
jgi:hypothetical protein